jgi:hypothetical protein
MYSNLPPHGSDSSALEVYLLYAFASHSGPVGIGAAMLHTDWLVLSLTLPACQPPLSWQLVLRHVVGDFHK